MGLVVDKVFYTNGLVTWSCGLYARGGGLAKLEGFSERACEENYVRALIVSKRKNVDILLWQNDLQKNIIIWYAHDQPKH